MSVCEILPNLWLGNENIAKSNLFFKRNNINIVVNCSKDIPFYSNYTQNIRIPVDDNLEDIEIDKLYNYLDKAANLMETCLSNNEGILVHCYAGKQRSATVIASYLMKYGNLKTNDAILSIKSKRLVAFTPKVNFKTALIKYEKYLSIE